MTGPDSYPGAKAMAPSPFMVAKAGPVCSIPLPSTDTRFLITPTRSRGGSGCGPADPGSDRPPSLAEGLFCCSQIDCTNGQSFSSITPAKQYGSIPSNTRATDLPGPPRSPGDLRLHSACLIRCLVDGYLRVGHLFSLALAVQSLSLEQLAAAVSLFQNAAVTGFVLFRECVDRLADTGEPGSPAFITALGALVHAFPSGPSGSPEIEGACTQNCALLAIRRASRALVDRLPAGLTPVEVDEVRNVLDVLLALAALAGADAPTDFEAELGSVFRRQTADAPPGGHHSAFVQIHRLLFSGHSGSALRRFFARLTTDRGHFAQWFVQFRINHPIPVPCSMEEGYGWPSLHLAAFAGWADGVLFLLPLGANACLRASSVGERAAWFGGESPFHIIFHRIGQLLGFLVGTALGTTAGPPSPADAFLLSWHRGHSVETPAPVRQSLSDLDGLLECLAILLTFLASDLGSTPADAGDASFHLATSFAAGALLTPDALGKTCLSRLLDALGPGPGRALLALRTGSPAIPSAPGAPPLAVAAALSHVGDLLRTHAPAGVLSELIRSTVVSSTAPQSVFLLVRECEVQAALTEPLPAAKMTMVELQLLALALIAPASTLGDPLATQALACGLCQGEVFALAGRRLRALVSIWEWLCTPSNPSTLDGDASAALISGESALSMTGLLPTSTLQLRMSVDGHLPGGGPGPGLLEIACISLEDLRDGSQMAQLLSTFIALFPAADNWIDPDHAARAVFLHIVAPAAGPESSALCQATCEELLGRCPHATSCVARRALLLGLGSQQFLALLEAEDRDCQIAGPVGSLVTSPAVPLSPGESAPSVGAAVNDTESTHPDHNPEAGELSSPTLSILQADTGGSPSNPERSAWAECPCCQFDLRDFHRQAAESHVAGCLEGQSAGLLPAAWEEFALCLSEISDLTSSSLGEGPVPDQYSALPRLRLQASEGRECLICTDLLSTNEAVIMTACMCVYHSACIRSWWDSPVGRDPGGRAGKCVVHHQDA
ncbi:hypothetical protein H696_01110 [Fonticula alba]|uniref:RING-type domain-containing protein n=1 Tax=Fonticula alba TaxID=691883 RepID=A0A058ZCM0_FONAL|nr:hypothetical protein H696_01110 [Fonticula alba]KCV71686.1 hypothetical protein H696_01110 [Fonticula alba]|eukprot:XP_009493264.1 hypothetical protein H696_01110 [Fonticula alba]